MKKFFFVALFLSLCIFNINSQISYGGRPMIHNDELSDLLVTIPTIVVPELDIESILMEDRIRSDSALRIGKLIDVDIDVLKQGRDYNLPDGSVIYLLKLKVPNAHSVELIFDPFNIPKGGKLFISQPDGLDFAGAFTSNNSTENRQLSTRAIIGDEVIIEYQTSEKSFLTPVLHLDYVCHNYVDIYQTILKKSSEETDCFYDVHCRSETNLSRSVMRWTYYDDGDNYLCSCALINQDVPNNELKYYVLTANHCGKDAELSTAKFYYNYQRPQCNTGSGTFRYVTVGASARAASFIYDMFLMELNEKPPPDYDVFFPGWNRDSYDDLYPWVIGIHHPYGWEKKLSEGDFGLNTNPNFWRISYYEYPTAPGSSGSPLFEDDAYQRIIGWDSYSYSSCSNPDGISAYGKLRKAWTGISIDDRLHDWLDPYDNDEISINGRDPCYNIVTISNRELLSAQEYYKPGNKVIIQAGSELNTLNSVIVFEDAEFRFQAGTKLKLSPGFSVQRGASFSATIEPCSQNKYGPFYKSSIEHVSDLTIAGEHQSEPDFEGFKIFPNPITDIIKINYLAEGESELRIYNSMGTLSFVYKDAKLSSNEEKNLVINIQELTSGIYFYKFSTGSKTYSGKILKQ